MTRHALKYVLVAIFFSPALLNAQDPLGEVVEALENQQMKRLAAQQNRPNVFITEFRSDGCSGGMSETWSNLADVFPEFARFAGDKPPWEQCCVDHDLRYWRGETENGFSKREYSDTVLRECVKLTGAEQSDAIAARLGLPEQEIITLINLTGDLMYHAVRVGGAPCTGLPWRWGHGWPPCSDDIDPDTGPELVISEYRRPLPLMQQP